MTRIKHTQICSLTFGQYQPYRNKHTQIVVPSRWGWPPFDLLKRGCANSGGFRDRWVWGLAWQFPLHTPLEIECLHQTRRVDVIGFRNQTKSTHKPDIILCGQEWTIAPPQFAVFRKHEALNFYFEHGWALRSSRQTKVSLFSSISWKKFSYLPCALMQPWWLSLDLLFFFLHGACGRQRSLTVHCSTIT